jgi:RNA polymerase sigma factor (sigma-70 family)
MKTLTAEQTKLLEDNIALAHWCVQKHRKLVPVWADEADFLSDALLTLVKVARNYRPDYVSDVTKRPVAFTSYATKAILRKLSVRRQRIAKQQSVAQTIQIYDVPKPDCGDGCGTAVGFWEQITASHKEPECGDEAAELLHSLIEQAQLTDKQRTILRMHFWEGASTKEIAAEIGGSEPLVRFHKNKAIERLKVIAGRKRLC